MKIRKLAEFIVNEYSEDSPGSESSQISIDLEVRRLKETLSWDGHGNRVVMVRIVDDI